MSAGSGRDIALVLAGGSALGAYQAGAYEVMHAAGLLPRRVIGTSAGAINAAIIGGNRPEDRVAKLREMWTLAAAPSALLAPPFGQLREWYHSLSALQSFLTGRPAMFVPRWPGMMSALPGMPNDICLLDHAPLERTLRRLIDFERLNGGEIEVAVCATDIETGAAVIFDTRHQRLDPAHLRASSGFMPAFPAVEIGGRLLGDGAFVDHLPLSPLFDPPPQRDLLCVAIDNFSRHGARPRSLDDAFHRLQDLMFTSHSARAIARWDAEHRLRRAIETLAERLPAEVRADPALQDALAQGSAARIDLLWLALRPRPYDTAAKMFDYSAPMLAERWESGRVDMAEGLKRLAEAPPGERPPFMVHEVRS